MHSYNVFYNGLQVEDISSDSIICIVSDTDIRYSSSDTSPESQKQAERYFSYKYGYDIDDVTFIEKVIDRSRAYCQALFKVNIRGVSDKDIEYISDCLDRSRIINEEIRKLDNKIEELNGEIEKSLALKEALEAYRVEIN